jgi:phosphoserine aminotransferase
MKKIRKVNTSKRKKEFKKAQKQLAERTSMLLNVPEKCCVCESQFDKKSKEMAMTWHVVVMEEKKSIYLTCPVCWGAVEEMAKKNAT